MSQPEQKENLPSGNENPPSRNEIATLAAMLLGASRVTAPGGGYAAAKAQDIAQACRDALDLIYVANAAAEAIKAGGEFSEGHAVVRIFEVIEGFAEKEAELAKIPGAELPPNIREQVKAAGWDGGPLGRYERLPWGDFFSRFMLPRKGSEKREERFRGWLESRLTDPQELEAHLSDMKARGISRGGFVAYLERFPAWWEKERSRTNRSNGKLGALAKKEGPKRKASKKSPVPKKKPSA
jgi:hypothetical protein